MRDKIKQDTKAFIYRGRELYCDGVRLTTLAETVGTPFYVYSRQRLENNFDRIERSLSTTDHLVCYSIKANGNIHLLRVFADMGCGADVVSGGELYLARKAGIPPERIVFAGVGKTDPEIREAIRQSILSIHIESFEEIGIVECLADEMNQSVKVSIRVNPDIDAKTHPYISTGLKKSKFGIPLEQAQDAFRMANSSNHLRVNGVHCHIGSMIMDPAPYVETAKSIAALIRLLKTDGIDIRQVDIGGGLGISYTCIVEDEYPRGGVNPPVATPEMVFSSILPVFRELNVRLIFEPGRYLVADAGVLVTRVILNKATSERKFVVVDAGMNDLIRPSLYDAYQQIVTVKKDRGKREEVSVVGPICESADFLAHDRPLPRVKRGDLLAVTGAGAYGWAMSSNYNGRPRTPEVLVDGDTYRLIRQREKIEDLWRGTSDEKT